MTQQNLGQMQVKLPGLQDSVCHLKTRNVEVEVRDKMSYVSTQRAHMEGMKLKAIK